MDNTRSAPLAAAPADAGTSPAQIAKAALRRLALARLEPTPENYARAYDEELGVSPRPVLGERASTLFDRIATVPLRDEAARGAVKQAFATAQWSKLEGLLQKAGELEGEQSRQLAALFDRLARGLERNDRQWTRARKKEGLATVLEGSRGDAQRLQRRLAQLLASWESDTAPDASLDAATAPVPLETASADQAPAEPANGGLPLMALTGTADWQPLLDTLGGALSRSLPAGDPAAPPAIAGLGQVLARAPSEGPTEALRALAGEHAREAERLLRRREALLVHTQQLCKDLADGLSEVAEDDSWVRGQCEALRGGIGEPNPNVRSVRSAAALLHETRARQRELRVERARARDALKSMIQQMLHEVGELGSQTGRFQESVGRYADVIESADSLESLAGVVREMVAESRTVHSLVSASQQRLQEEHARASELSDRVQTLEDELRRLSDEVSTDQLTQIANRRGLIRAFDAERSRVDRHGGTLALALLDVDDFKKLNDKLGHNAGDEALKSLAARVSQTLRPSDLVARYGGEEFVVMLPDTPLDEAQQVLTRMQRAMTEALFLHDSQPVFVTFSAGVTLHRDGERIEDALERADEALYEAKRTGKNRTCLG